MLEFALQLNICGRAGCLEDMRATLGGFLAASNALRLVHEKPAEKGKWHTESQITSGRYVVVELMRDQAPSHANRKRKGDGGGQEAPVDRRKARAVLSLQDLQRWVVVSKAYLHLAELSPPVRPQEPRHRGAEPPPISEVRVAVQQLCVHHLYEEAVQLAQAYSEDLAPVLQSLAAWCVQCQRGSQSEATGTAKALSDTKELQLLLRLLGEVEGAPGQRACSSSSFKLHLGVMDTLLREEPYLGFPSPLLESLRRAIRQSTLAPSELLKYQERRIGLGSALNFFEEVGLNGKVMVDIILSLALRHPTHKWLLHDAAIVVIEAFQAAERSEAAKEGCVAWAIQLERFMALLLHGARQGVMEGGWCTQELLLRDYEDIRKWSAQCSGQTWIEFAGIEALKSFQQPERDYGALKWAGQKEGLDSDAYWVPNEWSWSDSENRRQLYW